MKQSAFAFMLIFTSAVQAGDFATCILDKMPGTSNGAAQAAIHRSCIAEYPGGFTAIKRGSGRGIFGFKDQNACVIKKAKDTPWQYAAGAISIACFCLYKVPDFDGDMCSYQN